VHGAVLARDRFGYTNRAYSFDGTDDYIDLGNDTIDQNVFSFSVWFKTDRDKYAQTILGNYVACSYSGTGFTLLYYGSEAQNDPRLVLLNGSIRDTRSAIVHHVFMSDGNWHHIVRGHNENEYSLYIDNSLIGVQGGAYASTNKNLKVGVADYIGAHCAYGKGSFFDGSIDDLRIYDRVLSKAEIQALYSEGGWQGN
jgi:hypothetical protein